MTPFGRYTLIRKVGTGGMAEIWKAALGSPAGSGKVLAIKKILPQLVEEQGGGFIDLFIGEAKLAAQLIHPNIVQVFDFGRIGKRDYYIAMEYVAGANLARLVHRLGEEGRRLPRHCALLVVAEAARGLGYAHAKTDAAGRRLGLVHRDVSPQNLLVSFGGDVKVADFGIAKVASAMSMTAEGTVRGKISYMSPEQARAEEIDARSDVFSLGIVLWELLAGRRLFPGAAVEAHGKVVGFQGLGAELRDAIPRELQELVESMLAPDREVRFADMFSLESALSAHLGGGALLEARGELAALVRRLFAEELALEMDPSEVVPSDLAAVSAVAPPERPSLEGGIAVAAPVPPLAEQPTTTTPSQPTLAPPARDTVIVKAPSAPAFKLPAALESTPGPPASPADRARAGEGRSALRRPATMAGGALLVALVVGYAAGSALIGRGTPPATTETSAPIVMASLSMLPTPEAAVSELEPSPPASGTTDTAMVESTPGFLAAETPAPVTPEPGTPAPVSTRAVAVRIATPRTTPTPAPVRREGTIVVTARPWCEVWVDGKAHSRADVPQHPVRVGAGPHRIRFANPALRFSREVSLDVPAGGSLRVTVDAKAGTVKVQ